MPFSFAQTFCVVYHHMKPCKREDLAQIKARCDRLDKENMLISKQLQDLKNKEAKFDATLAAHLIERKWYLNVLENIKAVAKNEPELSQIEEILERSRDDIILDE